MIIKNLIIKFGYVLLLVYLSIFLPVLFSYKPLVIISGSMEPVLKVGGILYYSEIDLNKYTEGDILVYRYKNHTISHRIVSITNNGFITKGDSNSSVDSYLVNNNQVLGKGTNWSIPYLGYYADYVYNHKCLLFILVFILFLDAYIINSLKNNKCDTSKNIFSLFTVLFILVLVNTKNTSCLYTTSYYTNHKINTINYNFVLDTNGGVISNSLISFKNNKYILPEVKKDTCTFKGYSLDNSDTLFSNEIDDINYINNKKIFARWICS